MPRKVPTIRVKIEKKLYTNNINNYQFLQCTDTESNKTVFVHYCPSDNEGGMVIFANNQIVFKGKWNEDGTFRSKRAEFIKIPRQEEIVIFLKEAGIVGLTEERIASLVELYGTDTLSKLDDTDALTAVEDITPKIAEQIISSWEAIKQFFEAIKQLEIHQHNSWKLINGAETFTPAQYYMAYKKYGVDMVEVLKDDPYRLTNEFEVFSFEDVDMICGKIPGIFQKRSRGFVISYLRYCMESGDCYVAYEKVHHETLTAINNRASSWDEYKKGTYFENMRKEFLEGQDILFAMEQQGDITLLRKDDGKPEYVSLTQISQAEDDIALFLKEMINSDIMYHDIDVEHISETAGIQFDDDQRKAIQQACTSPITLITGGAGTGKTQTIAGIIIYFEECGKRVLLASPTAKAARNITKKTGHQAYTIHHMLRYNGISFGRDENNKLHGDVLIIDEASMIDLMMMQALIKAMPENMQLILVGDVNQLEPVDAGAPFRDMR